MAAVWFLVGMTAGLFVGWRFRSEAYREAVDENVELREANVVLAVQCAEHRHGMLRAREAAHEASEDRLDAYLTGYMEGRRDEKADHE